MKIFKRFIILIIFISIPTISYSAEMHGHASQPTTIKINCSTSQKKARPRVKMKEIQVEGDFTKMEVKKVIAKKLIQIKNCYHKELNKRNQLSLF